MTLTTGCANAWCASGDCSPGSNAYGHRHFYSTGATSHSVLSLRSSDTKLPLPRQVYASHTFPDDRTAPLDLRSARSRFELGKFNNRCCQLLAQRKPLATLSDIWKLDQDLVALEASVPPEQRLASDLDLSVIFQRPLRPAGPIDEALRNGQQIFYIGFWHISKRGVFFFCQVIWSIDFHLGAC
jgi:hypothetical protein